ncbi:MAG: outer membrane beta-barrel protein [Mariniphaga sp.]|nr:outer membrane beta-barrel protein [Mariniphaga sp.]
MKKQLIIGLSLLFYANTQAQETQHNLYFNAGGGLHNLSYDLRNGTEKGSFGYSVNAGYSYFFNINWGLQAGVGLRSFSPEATINYSTKAPSTDTEGMDYEYHSVYNNLKEKQELLFLDLPLGLQYQFEVNEKLRLLAGTGVKISIPVKETFKTTGGDITTTGYYSLWNVELSDMPQHGFENIQKPFTGDVSVKTSFSGFVDLGTLYELSSKLDLYTGCYFDYGLNNVLKSSDKLLYQQDGVYNGILASDQTNHARTISLGLKVGVLWHLGSEKTDKIITIAQPTFPIVSVTPPVLKAETIKRVIATVPPAPDTKKMDAAYIDARSIASSAKITFKNNSYQHSTSDDAKIKELSDLLKANPGMSLRILGRTSDIKTQGSDYHSALQKAGIVREKFLKQGVYSSQLIRGVIPLDKPESTNDSGKENNSNGTITLIVE